MEGLINFMARVLANGGKKVEGKRQLWWVDNKMGGYDGYELEPGGKLYLLNWDLFTGIKWEMSDKGLYTEIVYKGNGNVLKKTAQIVSLNEERMDLKEVTADNVYEHTYIKIAYGTIADKYYGHYKNGKSYVQVIPTDETQFQVVFSEHDKADVVKYDGYLDKATQTLKFTKDDKDVTLKHEVKGEIELLTVGSNLYYRPVM